MQLEEIVASFILICPEQQKAEIDKKKKETGMEQRIGQTKNTVYLAQVCCNEDGWFLDGSMDRWHSY